METKCCTRCGKTKPLNEFYRSASAKGGFDTQCKICIGEKRAKHYLEHREEVLERVARYQVENVEKIAGYQDKYRAEHREDNIEYQAKYRTEHPEEMKEHARRGHLCRNYGITINEYDLMLELQGGGCAICGRTPEENGRRLSVDHNHGAGNVRGLLCDHCNTALGLFQDSPELCRIAELYLRGMENK